MKVEMRRLEHVPRGWKPVKTYMGDFESYSEALDMAGQIASAIAVQRGYDSGSRFGWHLAMIPDSRPYAESKVFIEIYVL